MSAEKPWADMSAEEKTAWAEHVRANQPAVWGKFIAAELVAYREQQTHVRELAEEVGRFERLAEDYERLARETEVVLVQARDELNALRQIIEVAAMQRIEQQRTEGGP